MRFQQLVMETGPAEVTLTFHPRLTVITGLGRKEREGVIGELLGIMAGVRRNTRLDLLDDSGRHLSVRRADAPEHDKVVNLDNAHEVSLEFLNGGRVDLLHALDLDMERARRRWRLSREDMSKVSNGETLVASLATRNQRQLWAAAERVRAAEIRLAEEAEPVGSTADDVTTIEEIERRHNSFEASESRYDTVRIFGLFIGGFCAVAGASAVVAQRWTGAPLLIVAALTMLIAFVSRRRMVKTRLAERQGLAEAGAGSYVGFHMQRIAERLDRHEDRPSLKAAAAERREATTVWQSLAGGVSADWAFAMRDQITPAADRLAAGGRLRSPVGGAGRGQTSPAELAEALMIRLADLRHVGPDGESCPLILDEPLVGIDLPVKQWMLELVARTAGSPQVVYLTGDADVAAWAGIEALAGQLEVIGPGAPLDGNVGGEMPSLMKANGSAGSPDHRD
jgi:hypothetical protein